MKAKRAIPASQIEDWGSRVQWLLGIAKKTQATVASKVSLSPAYFSLILKNKRKAQFSLCRAINAAVAEEIGEPGVLAYLNALIAPSEDEVKEGFEDVLVLLDRRLERRYRSALLDGLLALPPTRKIAALADLNRIRRKRLARHITGERVESTFFDEIFELLARYKIDLRAFRRTDEDMRAFEAEDRFRLTLQNGLGETGAPVSQRNEIEQSIMEAFYQVVISTLRASQ